MNQLASLAFVPSLLLLTAPFAAPLRAQDAPIVVTMAPCEGKRPVQGFYVKSSRDLAHKGSLQVGGSLLQVGRLARGEHDLGAGLTQRMRHLQAEPARAACDEGHLAGEVEELHHGCGHVRTPGRGCS